MKYSITIKTEKKNNIVKIKSTKKNPTKQTPIQLKKHSKKRQKKNHITSKTTGL